MGSQAKYAVIGITDSRHQWFPPEVMEVIKAGKVFSGGKRHHEIMRDFLPENAVWIDITVPPYSFNPKTSLSKIRSPI